MRASSDSCGALVRRGVYWQNRRSASRRGACAPCAASSPARRRMLMAQPLVGVIMGSKSDWETLAPATEMLDQLGIPYEVEVVSAHRTPDRLFEYAGSAESRGLEVIIAGAGGA